MCVNISSFGNACGTIVPNLQDNSPPKRYQQNVDVSSEETLSIGRNFVSIFYVVSHRFSVGAVYFKQSWTSCLYGKF